MSIPGTINEMMSKYISSHQTDWNSYIDGIVLAYNTTPHKTTGIHQLARETMKNSKRQKRNFDKNIQELSYEVGDLMRRSQPKIMEGTTGLEMDWTMDRHMKTHTFYTRSNMQRIQNPLLFMQTTLNDTMAIKLYQVLIVIQTNRTIQVNCFPYKPTRLSRRPIWKRRNFKRLKGRWTKNRSLPPP